MEGLEEEDGSCCCRPRIVSTSWTSPGSTWRPTLCRSGSAELDPASPAAGIYALFLAYANVHGGAAAVLADKGFDVIGPSLVGGGRWDIGNYVLALRDGAVLIVDDPARAAGEGGGPSPSPMTRRASPARRRRPRRAPPIPGWSPRSRPSQGDYFPFVKFPFRFAELALSSPASKSLLRGHRLAAQEEPSGRNRGVQTSGLRANVFAPLGDAAVRSDVLSTVARRRRVEATTRLRRR